MRRDKMKQGSVFLFYIFKCYIVLTRCQTQTKSASIGFREANEMVSNQLKDDRQCNFLMDSSDAQLSTPEVIQKYGYPAERHWVTTEDGYILEIHRIPAKPKRQIQNLVKPYKDNESKPKPAVLLMHGVMSSSRDYVINCDKRALAFQLWDNGYDVWIGNYRGNEYCRNHTKLNVKQLQFWDFSIDEVGYFDIPATVDYILKRTKLKQISYVGHSMGNGVLLVMLTTRPEYNDKINMWFVMSAAVTLRGTSSPFLRILAAFPRSIKWFLTTFNHGELIPSWVVKMLHKYIPLFCRWEARTGNYHGLCSSFYFVADGYNPGQVPPELLSIIPSKIPSSTSVKFVIHWMQWIISGDFAMFDDGPMKNLQKYGSVKPKLYPLENFKTDAVLFWGENDWIVDPSDVKKTEEIFEKLRTKSSFSIEYFKVASPHWNHADFVLGKDADILVYSHIIKRLDAIYGNQSTNLNQENNGISDNSIYYN